MNSFGMTRQNGLQTSQSALVDLQAQIYGETREANRPIPQLMSWLLDRRNLEAAWDRVRNADGANTPGLDGVTCNDIHGKAIPWLAKLGDDLYRGVGLHLFQVDEEDHPLFELESIQFDGASAATQAPQG